MKALGFLYGNRCRDDDDEEEGEDITASMAFVIAASSLCGVGNGMLWNRLGACMVDIGFIIACSIGMSFRVSITYEVLGLFLLRKREEESGLSMDSDLNEDEEDEGRV